MEKRITHGSLFSGIGAPELAARWMGWQNLFHCETNEFCKRVLKFWFPESTGYDDIRTTDFTAWRGRVDVLTGGFPCQPFSSAGRRRGANDDRYLWPEMLRAVHEVRPAFVVGENVAGILSMVQPSGEPPMEGEAAVQGEGDTSIVQQYVTETVCQDLEKEGYVVQPFVIPACAVGAPHRRDRVWFIAKRLDADTDGGGYTAHQAHRAAEGERRYDDGEQGKRRASPQRTDGLHELLRTDADTLDTGIRASEHDGQQQGQTQPGERQDRPLCGACRPCDKRIAAYTDKSGLQEAWSPEQAEVGGEFHEGRLHPHTERVGRTEGGDDDGQPEGAQQAQGEPLRADCPQDWWRLFPSVSAVCRGNDGLPFDISRLAIPHAGNGRRFNEFARWRSESIKALGNSMVPQVVMELFRAIEIDFLS